MPVRPIVVCCALALVTVAFACPAEAQVRRSRYADRGDYHEFIDDPLHSQGAAPPGSRFIIRVPPSRTMLIRPRASFVQEMLKSVETM